MTVMGASRVRHYSRHYSGKDEICRKNKGRHYCHYCHYLFCRQGKKALNGSREVGVTTHDTSDTHDDAGRGATGRPRKPLPTRSPSPSLLASDNHQLADTRNRLLSPPQAQAFHPVRSTARHVQSH